ncbi:YitT family protein [Marinilabiliaceae bacterium JC017]|nr:YitT family protein [Marinilabiliaceae bacterium JC017]
MTQQFHSRWLKELQSYLIITMSLFIAAIGWTGFIIPSNIVGGGLMGLSSIIYFVTDMPVGPTNFVMNAVLIAIAMKVLGKGFGVKTIYCLAVLSIMVSFMQVYITEPIVKEKFMAAIIGGGMVGASIGILFTQGGSTGGTEVIAMMVNRYRNISPGRVMMLCDLVIIGSSYLVFKSLETLVYGYVVMGMMSYVADMLLTGSRQSVQIFIVSEKPKDVAEEVMKYVNRGLTFVNGRGWYSNTPKEFIVLIAKKSESHLIFHAIKAIDPNAFVSVASVMGVYGKGFDEYKPPLKAKKKNNSSEKPQGESVSPKVITSVAKE